jgi:4-hydroxy-4-methyl-2-oxoglutarate aldolase
VSSSIEALSTRLAACYTGAVHDVLRARGVSNCALPAEIKATVPGVKIAGPVFTLSGRLVENLSAHETLIQWTRFLSRAPQGSIVICQPNTHAVALMGELSSETLKKRGVRGYIVDGGCRDTDFIDKIGFPVFCSLLTPADIVGRWMVSEIGKPIAIGGVTIANGDFALADRDGVVIISQSIAGEVLDEAESVLSTESKVRTAILSGEDPEQAYLKFGKF